MKRWQSRTAYAHLRAQGVSGLLRADLPELVNQTAAPRLRLPSGAHVARYLTADAAEVSLPGARRELIESIVPIARRDGRRSYAPIDLSIVHASGGYVPAHPAVAVHIPNQLSAGVSLPGEHIALTPIGSEDRALHAQGNVLGASVLYANAQLSTDAVVKPTATGFELDAILRAPSSPQRLYYRVAAPSGTSLAVNGRTGVVRLVRRGATLATIAPPHAEDAAHVSVPAQMRLAGSTIVVEVPHRSGSYTYPIVVDPEVNDSQLTTTSAGKASNWEFATDNSSAFAHEAVYEGPGKERLETKGIGSYSGEQYAYWAYKTKGNSKIYELKANTAAHNAGAKIESFLEFGEDGSHGPKRMLSNEYAEPEYASKASTVCADNSSGVEECLPGSGREKNAVLFQQSATGTPSAYNFSDKLTEGIVSISEPAGDHASTKFNTWSPEVEGEVVIEGKKVTQKRVNALYDGGTWLTNASGALQLIAKDPGIGVAKTHLEYENASGEWERLSEHNYLEGENACEGVQCYAEHKEYWTLDSRLPQGEDKLRYRAQEAMPGTESLAEEAENTATVKVDTEAPRNLTVGGLPWGNELTERPYEITTEATDGEGAAASSGVAGVVHGSKGEAVSKGLALYIDGHEVAEVGEQSGCASAHGQCTATAHWTINGAELGAGRHAIVLVATDRAGNQARVERTLSIRHSTPVSIGPGSVDLQSGDFTLAGSDVSMGSGLTISRTYSSRATEAGVEGPLGPQWSMNVGTADSLVEMVDGSVLLTDANGQQSIFAKVGAHEFEAPTGDSNLSLRLEEDEATKEKLAYYLEDAAKHTKTKFTLPSGGTKVWVPTRQEGTVATDTVSYAYRTASGLTEYSLPEQYAVSSIVTGSDGRLWYAGSERDLIGAIAPSGTPAVEYKLPKLEEEIPKRSLTAGPEGDIWFTSRYGYVGKMTPEGEVTEYHMGTYTFWTTIADGTEGNVWTTSSHKIAKITATGKVTEYASSYTPDAMTAGPEGDMWFDDEDSESLTIKNIGRITPAGAITEFRIPGETPGVGGIVEGPDGNLWFTDGTQIGKMTPSGAFTFYSLPAEHWADQIAVGPDGRLWFTEGGADEIGAITTKGTISEYALPAESKPDTITAGPDGKMWFGESGGTYPSKKIGTITVSGTIVEPTEVLAPVPAGVSCSPMKAGCRALKLTYAEATTATGESETQWGDYKGRLKSVALDAYDPETEAMRETAVAEYSYDQFGRLRAEWDPRISPAEKVRYGYDSEGHVTALTPPGQESWAFTYGPIAGDAGSGRLQSVTRAPASAPLWGGSAEIAYEMPQLTGTALVGSRMAVSEGEWSGGPIAYAYQWEDCNAAGKSCAPIVGARNANYTPTRSDIGHRLRASVTAVNGDGAKVLDSAVSAAVEEEREIALDAPQGVAVSGEGNLWVAAEGGSTIDKVTPEGKVTKYPLPSESAPYGITAGPEGDMWFTDFGTSKIGKITTAGTVQEYALPSGSRPIGIAAGPEGDLWFVDYSTSKVGKITTAGTVTEYALPAGADPEGGIAAGPDGNMWVTLAHLDEIAKVTTAGAITTYALPAGSRPRGIAVGPDKEMWFAEYGTHKIGKITTTGAVTEYALPAGSLPDGIVADGTGGLSFTNMGFPSRIGHITTAGAISEFTLQQNETPKAIVFGPEEELWFTSTGGLGSLPPDAKEAAAVTPMASTTLDYGVSLTSGAGRQSMTSSAVGKWGQTDVPTEATAVLPADARQGWPAVSYSRATIYYLDEDGREVNVATPSTATHGAVATSEYNEENDVVRTLSVDNMQKALEAGTESANVAKSLSTYYSYREECSRESEDKNEAEAAAGTRLCDVEGPQHEIKYVAGKEQREALGRLHTKYFYDENAPEGETYNLQTKTSTLAELANEEEVEVRKTTTSYAGQGNLGWKLRAPTSVTVDPEGAKLTSTTLYDSATGDVTETRAPAGAAGGSAHDVKDVYYSAEANSEGHAACGGHPEWSGLLCESLPAKEPESSPAPPLPSVRVTYNRWNEPVTVTETFGAKVRTKTNVYDEAGRLTSTETTSSADTPLPKVVDEYNSASGMLEKQSTSSEGETKTITSVYNRLGQLVEYTDADGNVTKYRYGGPENDGLLEEVSDGSDLGTGKQTYAYNPTTKELEKLTDSAAGVFSATYDAEGNLTSEIYPNGMCANTAYSPVGEATSIEYVKTTKCAEAGAPVWFKEERAPSVRGETLTRSSTLAQETYAYDSLGRLVETRETPTGEGCTTRLYAYDEEGNRISQTTRQPGAEGKCANEGGVTVEHSYDEGNRLIDPGVEYDPFGNVTSLPGQDAGDKQLSSSFYVDGAVASQTQNGVTDSYLLDPEGRVRETVSGTSHQITHYDGPGEAVAWTTESASQYTRNIPGIDGTLAALQTNGETPVLQLHDLEGDIVATAALNPEATKLLSTYNSTEFGVPTKEEAPPKYAWLGAGGVASAFPSGVITYGATSYVPQIGRSLQSEAVEAPGIAPGGTGAGAAYVSQEEPWVMQGAAAEATEAPGLEAAREQAAMKAAIEIVDPTKEMNRKKAAALAAEFQKIKTIAEVVSLIDIPGDVGEAVVSELWDEISLNRALDWYREAAEKLEKCANNKRYGDTIYGKLPADICRFEYESVDIFGVEVATDFGVEPKVQECFKTPSEPVPSHTYCEWEVYVYKVAED